MADRSSRSAMWRRSAADWLLVKMFVYFGRLYAARLNLNRGASDLGTSPTGPPRTLRRAGGRRPRAADHGGLWPLACAERGISALRAASRSRPQAVVAALRQP